MKLWLVSAALLTIGVLAGAQGDSSGVIHVAPDKVAAAIAKGGQLVGTSHRRIGFLDEVVRASPTGVLEPLPSDFDLPWAGVQDHYLVSYHGWFRPRERHVLLPPGRWHVEVLDTWECTVNRLPGLHQTFVLVPLPAKPFQAVRLVAG